MTVYLEVEITRARDLNPGFLFGLIGLDYSRKDRFQGGVVGHDPVSFPRELEQKRIGVDPAQR